MKNKSINQVSIINGEDGPTSVFIFGEAQKQSLKIRIRNAIYQSRRKRIEKRIAANPHTLAEVVQYAKDHYDLVEINPAATNWIERQKNLKASLIMQHKPELLGQRKDIPKPDFHNEESVKNFLNELNSHPSFPFCKRVSHFESDLQILYPTFHFCNDFPVFSLLL